ncbi:gliding motility protein GldB [Labilibacter sediminis]|nr:gliding motility protein GldB [Labilibacter sediminis]
MNRQRTTYIIALFFVLLCVLSTSCKDKQLHPDVSSIEVELNVIPFYQEFGAIDTLNVETDIQPIIEKYPQFMQAYSRQIVKLGSTDNPEYYKRTYDFLTYDANKDIFKKAGDIFSDHQQFSSDLEEGFKHYKYYFKDVNVPDVYLMVSGFSQSIAVDSAWVGVSIEKYLGEDCEFYEWLNIPKYLRKGMTKEKMASDVIRAMALTNYTYDTGVNDLINNMVYKGKVRYFVHRMFPDLQDSLLFDYSAEQIHWCQKNEDNMWASMVEWKHIFSNDRMLIQKYTGDAPFTANFGNNSAPRAGEYIGYKIVESYMKNNEEITLKDLMEEQDGRKILAASRYRP